LVPVRGVRRNADVGERVIQLFPEMQ